MRRVVRFHLRRTCKARQISSVSRRWGCRCADHPRGARRFPDDAVWLQHKRGGSFNIHERGEYIEKRASRRLFEKYLAPSSAAVITRARVISRPLIFEAARLRTRRTRNGVT